MNPAMASPKEKSEDDAQIFTQKLGLSYADLRRKARISQVNVAAMIALLEGNSECSQSYLSKFEHGRYIATQKRMELLCDVIGIPPELLYMEAMVRDVPLTIAELRIIRNMRELILRRFVPATLPPEVLAIAHRDGPNKVPRPEEPTMEVLDQEVS